MYSQLGSQPVDNGGHICQCKDQIEGFLYILDSISKNSVGPN
jgi:hypothetical protein